MNITLTRDEKRAVVATALGLHRACELLSKFTCSSPEYLLLAISNYIAPGALAMSDDLIDEVLVKLLDKNNVQPNGFSIIAWSHKKGCRR